MPDTSPGWVDTATIKRVTHLANRQLFTLRGSRWRTGIEYRHTNSGIRYNVDAVKADLRRIALGAPARPCEPVSQDVTQRTTEKAESGTASASKRKTRTRTGKRKTPRAGKYAQ